MLGKIFFGNVLIVGSLLLSSIAYTQSQVEPQPRRVKGQTLTSDSRPSIRIKFGTAFKYVGSQQFILYDRAQVEQQFFVAADKQQHLKRMYMVQFESYLPDIKGAYNYTITKTLNLAGETYLVDAEFLTNVSAVIKQDSQSDVAHAASFLERKGFHLGEAIVYQRFVRLIDETKRSEFILLYVEDAIGDAAGNEKAMQELASRALKDFKILK
jgi:hypothetical protein